MIKLTLRFLAVITFLVSQSSSVELTCRYHTNTDWWAINYVYFCDQVTDVEIQLNDVVEKINGEHYSSNSNADVKGFRVDGKILHYFPQGLDKFFTNLEFLAIWTTGLKEIHQNELKPFTKLRILSIWNNEIEVIERDLLKFNENIEYIGFGKNKIKFVDGKVFNRLNKLHTLHIDGNPCISRQVAGNQYAVWDLVDDIEEKCGGESGANVNDDKITDPAE